MKRLIRVLLFSAIVALGVGLHAQSDAGPTHIIYGLGNQSCGMWMAAGSDAKIAYQSWVSGYISALTAAHLDVQTMLGVLLYVEKTNPNENNAKRRSAIESGSIYLGMFNVRDTDVAAMTAWIDNYCKASPLKSIQDASAALSLELLKK